ncbi:hypothetical protein DQ04_08191020 [Trypanosoma grayi]|uniref:hypothetical protein n=1 Tax=Trypanosoma grayi TaxID=71804 RepID=UPI0004F49B6A|nr:hypothetical protein DQ04_08191020 [Trypanosoma grayi]KEG08027.1 hypothetical protein DQ04_08191020 [Trypanosoma grayi]
MTYVHTQRTLRLRGEEVTRLQKELDDKSKEIERLKALLELVRKKRPLVAGGARAEEAEENGAAGAGATRVTPSLALFAATADDGVGRGQPARMLLELRQNIASRDTVIDGLRMELGALRKAEKDMDEALHAKTTELEEARALCASLTADLSAKDARIEELQKRCVATTPVGRTGDTRNSSISHGIENPDVVLLRQKLEEYKQRCRVAEAAVSATRAQLQSLEIGAFSSRPTAIDPPQQQQEAGLRAELEHLQRCLQREKDTSAELERHWRQRLDSDRRMTESDVDTARSEAEACRREVARMQRQLTTASFAEAQLQAARNENDTLQQRVVELREENSAQAARERELRNELRATKEVNDRREDEVVSLQRRLKIAKDSEGGLREEVEMLEGKLERAEERFRAVERESTMPQRVDGVEPSAVPRELSSYAALMALNTQLQERLQSLEAELRTAKTAPASEEANSKVGSAAVAATGGGDAVGERIARIGAEVAELREGLQRTGASLQQLQAEFAASSVSNEQLQAELQSVRGAYGALSQRWGEVARELAGITDGGSSGDASESGAKEVQRPPSARRKPRADTRRGRVQELPQQQEGPTAEPSKAAVTVQHNDEERCAELQVEVQRLRGLLCKRDEELQRARTSLAAAKAEADVARKQEAVYEELVRGVGERKVSSLRAARIEAAHWRQQVAELQRLCEEQKHTIANSRTPQKLAVQDAPQSASCSGTVWDDEYIIEEALRQEAARLDAELGALRSELQTTRVELDHWKTLAVGATTTALCESEKGQCVKDT